MSVPVLPIVIIGGVAYQLSQAGAGPSTPPPTAGTPSYGAGATPGATVGQLQTPPSKPGRITVKRPSGVAGTAATKTTTWPTDVNLDPELQKKLALIEAAAKKSYDDANAVAKAAAADKLNKDLKLDPKLTGHEDWKTISSVVGGAVGGGIGAAIGGPLGAKIGALCGAYLGAKIEDLIEKHWDDLKSWVSDKWGDVKDFAEDAYDEVTGWLPF